MNKSLYKRHTGKGKNIADRLRENGIISISPKLKKWDIEQLIKAYRILVERTNAVKE